MSVVCGIDFSPASLRAAGVAARLARRWEVPLHLVHAVSEAPFGDVQKQLADAARLALLREAEQLRSEHSQIEAHLVHGKPDEALVAYAKEAKARLIVLSALGTRAAHTWQVGGSTERVAASATCPTLVIRDPSPWYAWFEGRHTLKLMVGFDRSRSSSQALRIAGDLRRMGPCALEVSHLYWPPEEFHRLGFAGVHSLVDPDPQLEQLLRSEILKELTPVVGDGPLEVRVELALGRVSDRLIALGREAAADLVLVGVHPRTPLERAWTGSVSRAVLFGSQASVLCAPLSAAEAEAELPVIQSVLVATDFSPTGDEALRWAFGLAQPGGLVHLLHVTAPVVHTGVTEARDILDVPPSPEDRAAHEEARAQLEQRIPPAEATRGVLSRTHVAFSHRPAEAICQIAERLSVDAIVVGTRGRTGVVRAVLGSVAQEVAATARKPVLLVNPSHR